MKDNFSSQADVYARYRPSYPPELFAFILEKVKEREQAWDCATGNGQTASVLAREFKNVFATDISQQQLDHATKATNLHYIKQPAEKTGFSDNSFDLITVSQAIHWFDLQQFYAEAVRVAKPGAVIAAWCYSLLKISPAIDGLIGNYHFRVLENYWDAERRYVDEEYKTIPFPFRELISPSFQMIYHWDLQQLEGYLHTWSALQKFINANHQDPVKGLIKQIKETGAEEPMRVVFPIHLRIGIIEK